MKKFAMLLACLMLLMSFSVFASAETYDNGVFSLDVPSRFQSVNMGNGKCWMSDNYGFIFTSSEKNTQKESTVHASDELKKKIVKSFEDGMLEGMEKIDNSMNAEPEESTSSDATINGYDGMKITTSIRYTQSGTMLMRANVECYVFTTENDIIYICAMGFSGNAMLGDMFDGGFEDAKQALSSLKINDPILKPNSAADLVKSPLGLIVIGVVIVVIILLIVLIASRSKKKKKLAAQQIPSYGAPVNGYMPQQNPNYGAPANGYAPQQTPPYNPQANSYAPQQNPNYGAPVNGYAPQQTPPYNPQANSYAPQQNPNYGAPSNGYAPQQTPPYGTRGDDNQTRGGY